VKAASAAISSECRCRSCRPLRSQASGDDRRRTGADLAGTERVERHRHRASRTKDGHALLLINPHTSFFFRSELQMTSREGLNAYGAVTWGQFFIYQGFNAHAGWMHTSSGIDNVDEFAETVVDSPTGAKGYRYGGQIRPLAKNTITLRYRRPDGTMASRSFTTWASHHGPIVREEGAKWIAFALMNRPVAALEQSYLRTKTRDLSEFLKVAERKANSSNNTLFADDKGEIAYLHPQFVPIRDTRFDYTKPVDGSDPATDWRGLHALDTLPSVLNPKNGWAFNTNNAPWTAAGADSPGKPTTPSIWTNWAKTHVAPMRKRCWASGGTSRCLRLSRLPTIPGFRRSSTFAPLFDAAASDPGNADRQAAIALLKGWDRRWSAGSTATTLAVNWGEALWAKRGDHPDPEDDSTSVWDWMERHASPAQRLAALDEAIARLKGDFGDWRVPWGDMNRYQRNDGAIDQVFSDAEPSTPIPFASARWGSLASFGAKRYPGTKRYYGTSGNSFVAAVEFGPRVTARAVSIGGESNVPASPISPIRSAATPPETCARCISGRTTSPRIRLPPASSCGVRRSTPLHGHQSRLARLIHETVGPLCIIRTQIHGTGFTLSGAKPSASYSTFSAQT
jgi:acyl-homoserine-lactone acylase